MSRMMRRQWVTTVLVGAAVLGCAGAEAARGGAGRASEAFAPARVVSQETENGATPMFLVTPKGDRVVAWVSAPGGGSDGALHFSVTPADGATLPTVTVRDSLGPVEAHGEAPPQLAADSAGRIYAMYLVGKVVPGQRFPVSALRFIRSEDGGRTWSAPISANDQGKFGEFGSHNFHALTVAGDGSLLATWLDGRSGKSGVWMARSSDGGRRWTPNTAIYSDSTCPCCRTAVASAADGSVFVAWRAVLPGDVRDVVVMRGSAGAGGDPSWAEPVRPREDGWVYPGCPHAGPAMKLDRTGTLHVAWWTGKPGEAGVYYARSSDGGRTFEAQPMAVAKSATPAHVQLALLDSGKVAVAWDDGHSAMPRILLRVSRDRGSSFGQALQLSDEGAAASYPVLGAFGDSLAVAWTQRGAEAHHQEREEAASMRDKKTPQGLPRVGQAEILLRVGKI